MQCISHYRSPLGKMILSGDERGLTGLWFEGQKYASLYFGEEWEEKELPLFSHAKKWLDIYFSGKMPSFALPLCFEGTAFQMEVWKILCSIPYGKTVTYGEIANRLAKEKGIRRMSAQAVGGAVGHNKIAIIVPCHRVVGKNGSITGYAGGIDRKTALLKLEKADTENLFAPNKETAVSCP